VRTDVCDTYHTYLKCIDLTKTGLAIPVVDELATIPLGACKHTISVYMANKKQILVPGARLVHNSRLIIPAISFEFEVAA
jgi:formate dehydrogenase maturation protein FdhE